MMLTKDQFLKAAAVEFETVPLGDELDAPAVQVRGMTAQERDRFSALGSDDSTPIATMLDYRRKIVRDCLLTPDREPMFSDDDDDVIDVLSADAIERIWTGIRIVSGFSVDDMDDIESD